MEFYWCIMTLLLFIYIVIENVHKKINMDYHNFIDLWHIPDLILKLYILKPFLDV